MEYDHHNFKFSNVDTPCINNSKLECILEKDILKTSEQASLISLEALNKRLNEIIRYSYESSGIHGTPGMNIHDYAYLHRSGSDSITAGNSIDFDPSSLVHGFSFHCPYKSLKVHSSGTYLIFYAILPSSVSGSGLVELSINGVPNAETLTPLISGEESSKIVLRFLNANDVIPMVPSANITLSGAVSVQFCLIKFSGINHHHSC